MNNVAIRAENLGKQYYIGQLQGGGRYKYKTLRDTLSRMLRSPFQRARKLMGGQATGAADLDEAIWALRQVSFEVKQGEVLGIIGRNGAGKSTLLKILSRITEPTTGFVNIRGRVGSLLEVGTGFHPELTGRENLFLYGAILGMKRTEIERKFEEIVHFAEVEKFIDTPIKHYSSGMYLRLAFAVAAHLEPEILLVDEVLAVGDANFQKKCMNKMEAVGQEGRTVLFVSHNMPAITRLCQRVILLDEGRIIEDGPAQQVTKTYLESGLRTSAAREWTDPQKLLGGEAARLWAVRVRNEQGQIAEQFDICESLSLEMDYEVLTPGYVLLPHFHLFNEDGVHVFATLDLDPTWRRRPRPVGYYRSQVRIPGDFLADGTLFVHSNLMTLNPNKLQFSARDAVAFQVIDHQRSTNGWKPSGGVIRPRLNWETQFKSNVPNWNHRENEELSPHENCSSA